MNIPEFKAIEKDYKPEYWESKKRIMVKVAKRLCKELGFYPDWISIELIKYIEKDSISKEVKK